MRWTEQSILHTATLNIAADRINKLQGVQVSKEESERRTREINRWMMLNGY